MQETKRFTPADGKTILVEVNSAEGNTTAVLMVHGFTGDINEHIFYNASQQWPKKGLDVWRISLYPGEAGTRTMATVTWEQNFLDIDLVLKEMAKQYEKLFLVGHSRGGTQAVYIINQKLKAKVLWDPSYLSDVVEEAQEELHPDYYTLDWGHIILASKNYTNEGVSFSDYRNAPIEQPPILVIRASDNDMGWPKALRKKLVKIKNSDHCFNKDGNEKKLFSLTLNFFKKHSLSQPE